ncbi:MAG: hypothetical protein ACRD1P_08485, partial [Thermoanaerobaculia bacterium]
LPAPDFRKFDRLRGLIEAKIRWCGAQPVVESLQDNRVQIVIQQFTPPRQVGACTPDLGGAYGGEEHFLRKLFADENKNTP